MVTVTLRDNAALALAQVLTSLSPDQAAKPLRNDGELANFIEARVAVTKAADGVIHADRALRRG